MFGSRMTAAGVVFLLTVAFLFGGLSLLGPLVSFLTPTLPDGSKIQLFFPGLLGPFEQNLSSIISFMAAGAAIGLGALFWLRFARYGPYLRVMAMLLGVVVVSGLLAAICYRYYLAASYASDSSLAAGHFYHLTASYATGSRPTVGLEVAAVYNSSAVYKVSGRIPLIAAGAALLVGAVMCAVRGRASKDSGTSKQLRNSA